MDSKEYRGKPFERMYLARIPLFLFDFNSSILMLTKIYTFVGFYLHTITSFLLGYRPVIWKKELTSNG